MIERHEQLNTADLDPQSLQTLDGIYSLDGVLDVHGEEAFTASPLTNLRKYLGAVEGHPALFGFPPDRDMAMGASYALRLEAFRDAQKGLVWPTQHRAPHKTFDTHPWEHNGREYPGNFPTGVTLNYALEPSKDHRKMQRVFGVGDEGVRYKLGEEQVPHSSFAQGLGVIKDTYNLIRNEDSRLLSFYFAHRDEIRNFLKAHTEPARPDFKMWNAQLKFGETYKSGTGFAGSLRKDFALQMNGLMALNLPREALPGSGETEKYVSDIPEGERHTMASKLFYFGLIDSSLDGEIDRTGLDNAFSHDELFRKCKASYAKFLRKEEGLARGAVISREARPLFNFETYALIVHFIMFESDNLLTPSPASWYSGMFLDVDQLITALESRGINGAHTEEVADKMGRYFENNGITLTRNGQPIHQPIPRESSFTGTAYAAARYHSRNVPRWVEQGPDGIVRDKLRKFLSNK
ncbi:MAG: hypothetical protein WCT53_04885 [Candidatus Gracilibacteria bacterium]